jgi:hypothetical protein
MTAADYGLARRMWQQLEPIHAVFWYAPEVFQEAAATPSSGPGSCRPNQHWASQPCRFPAPRS